MSTEAKTMKLIILGAASQMDPEQRARFDAKVEAIRELVQADCPEDMLALGLVSLELQE